MGTGVDPDRSAARWPAAGSLSPAGALPFDRDGAPAGRRVRVLLADSQPLFLDGIHYLLSREPDFAVVGRCQSVDELLATTRTVGADLLVLDVRIGGQSGLEALRALQDEGRPIAAVILAADLGEDEAGEAVRLGVRAVILKSAMPASLVRCLRRASAGHPGAARTGPVRVTDLIRRPDGPAVELAKALTARELQIAGRVAAGLRNKAIARDLSISEGTAKIHLHNIYEKLGLDGRFSLALWARERGLVA
jgi:DNA-binding NarL/FixJ family response regulator